MCFPVIQSITFDKASYTAGSTITATVTYVSCCSDTFSVQGFDDGGRKWTVKTNDGTSTATLVATA